MTLGSATNPVLQRYLHALSPRFMFHLIIVLLPRDGKGNGKGRNVIYVDRTLVPLSHRGLIKGVYINFDLISSS